MSKLSSFQRKLVYLVGIGLLLITVNWLGRPPEPPRAGQSGTPGGLLAQKRSEYKLGEQNLGNVDPASSTMNLLLLGFRGIATSYLWMDAQEQQRNKDWAALRSSVDSIILLQPHFLKVWVFQGWNLAYNVSAEWDLVPDRYYWVKEGIKFLKKGIDRNQTQPELYWYAGDGCGKKIGRSDEWRQFRRFFLKDPDTVSYPGGLDKDINPEGKDNYLVAKGWFEEGLRVEHAQKVHGIQQHIMADYLFEGYPARAQIDYAMALQRDGVFEEKTRIAWQEAFHEWTTKYGRIDFDNPSDFPVHMEITSQELAQMRRRDEEQTEDRNRLEQWLKLYQDTTNYRFWRTRCKAESESEMSEARRALYEAERAYVSADMTKSRTLFEQGMTTLEKILDNYPDLKIDDQMIEDVMVTQLFWRSALETELLPQPDESAGYPLQEMWNNNQNRLYPGSNVLDEFQRRKRAPAK